jgi:hypothetical protein
MDSTTRDLDLCLNAPCDYPSGPWHALKQMTWYRFLRRMRKKRDSRLPRPLATEFDFQGQAASDQVRALLEHSAPCMIGRFGGVEMRTVSNFMAIHARGTLRQRLNDYLSGASGPWWWDDRTKREMIRQAGFFPVDPEHLDRFARLFMADCTQVDLLGSWSKEEGQMPVSPQVVRVPLMELEPYLHGNPWSEALKGKRVLVVHPFEKSIQTQYARKHLLFKDPRVLPDFTLITLKAVQSLGGVCPGFADWFEALKWMEDAISRIEFDVAIIGAGAYGMALAAFVKRELGRKAVHLGGAVQILFGIKGRRWDDRPPYFDHIYNEHWIRPLAEETPEAASRVEGGCYW